jgi:hypothetical protein
MAHYYFEYGGGLGDVLARMSIGCSFNVLHTMTPEDTARVLLITHNPHAREIFDHHPKAAQIEVKAYDYWWPAQDRLMRARLGLPYPPPRVFPTTKDPVITFFPAQKDKALIAPIVDKKFVVFSVSGSDGKRDYPPEITQRIVDICLGMGILPVFVGQDYIVRCEKPWKHVEFRPTDNRAISLINQIMLPTVCYLVQQSLAAVACHSAIATLAWSIKKHQLMLYPKSVNRMITEDRPRLRIDVDPLCNHAFFDDAAAVDKAIAAFTEVLSGLVKGGEQQSEIGVSS